MARPKANAAIDALQMGDLAFDEAAFASSLREEVNDAIIAAGWCCCVVWCSAWFFVTSYVVLWLMGMGSTIDKKVGGRWDC